MPRSSIFILIIVFFNSYFLMGQTGAGLEYGIEINAASGDLPGVGLGQRFIFQGSWGSDDMSILVGIGLAQRRFTLNDKLVKYTDWADLQSPIYLLEKHRIDLDIMEWPLELTGIMPFSRQGIRYHLGTALQICVSDNSSRKLIREVNAPDSADALNADMYNTDPIFPDLAASLLTLEAGISREISGNIWKISCSRSINDRPPEFSLTEFKGIVQGLQLSIVLDLDH